VAGQPWWNDSTFYEVFVRSFADSDSDGIGDLPGLIGKLDYLNDGDPDTTSDLGVTGLWLMPIMASPSYHGYDITDYYTVNPQYGTDDDFRRLMAEAHRRGMRVIIDLVLNHTSSQHPWFVESQDAQSDKRDWYVWSESKPAGQGWHAGANGGYYYGHFSDRMPDLNYNNPQVTAAMDDVVRFWLNDMQVDGFRLDAVKYLYEDGARIEHLPATHAWLKAFRLFYKGVSPQAFTVGEVVADTDTSAKYVDAELDTVFEFTMAEAMLKSAQGGETAAVDQAQQAAMAAYPAGQYATFLANHDQNRTRSRLLADDQAKTAASLEFSFPGVPFIYYGEEIGMQGQKPDENIRRPMQWTSAGGFTTGTPWNAYYEDVTTRNVAAQEADAGSILSHYRAWVRLRNEHAALRVGAWVAVDAGDSAVYAALRWTVDERILVLINLSNKPVSEYALTLAQGPLVRGMQPALLLGQADVLFAPRISSAGGFKGYRPVETLAPRSTYLIQLLP
jgi:alpha-amylase